jgi:hypothetical protein
MYFSHIRRIDRQFNRKKVKRTIRAFHMFKALIISHIRRTDRQFNRKKEKCIICDFHIFKALSSWRRGQVEVVNERA